MVFEKREEKNKKKCCCARNRFQETKCLLNFFESEWSLCRLTLVINFARVQNDQCRNAFREERFCFVDIFQSIFSLFILFFPTLFCILQIERVIQC